MKRPKPQSAVECRDLIAAEVVRERLIPGRITAFYKALRMFERVEKQQREDRKLAALEDQNRLLSEQNELRKQDYRLRALKSGNGTILVNNLQRQLAVAERTIAELKAEIVELSGKVGVQSGTRGVDAA